MRYLRCSRNTEFCELRDFYLLRFSEKDLIVYSKNLLARDANTYFTEYDLLIEKDTGQLFEFTKSKKIKRRDKIGMIRDDNFVFDANSIYNLTNLAISGEYEEEVCCHDIVKLV